MPWDAQAGLTVNLKVVTQVGGPSESTAQAVMIPVASAPALVNSQTPVAYHQDWSGPVTMDIVYLYATGLGPVQPAAQTGVPAGAAMGTLPLSCNAPLMYAGLAPGLIGYYQLNVRMPAIPVTRPYAQFFLHCNYPVNAYIPELPSL